MSKERTIITQKLCDHVKALLAGKLTHKQAAEFTGIGKATVDRIVAAGFNAEQYAKNTAARKEEREQKQAEELRNRLTAAKEIASQIKKNKAEEQRQEEQVPGQIEMDLTEKKPKNYQEALEKYCMEAGLDDRDKKLMRFEAAMVDKIIKAMDEDVYKSFIATKTDFILDAMQRQNEKLDKIIDMLGQILRRMDK